MTPSTLAIVHLTDEVVVVTAGRHGRRDLSARARAVAKAEGIPIAVEVPGVMPSNGEGLRDLSTTVRYMNGQIQTDLGFTPSTRQQFEALARGNKALRCDRGHHTQLGRSQALRLAREAASDGLG